MQQWVSVSVCAYRDICALHMCVHTRVVSANRVAIILVDELIFDGLNPYILKASRKEDTAGNSVYFGKLAFFKCFKC